ncbi:aminotransferase class V-fold PLP-dependent enzyme [Halioxenophilus aromaticivorans]|uniref:NAD-dependent epimerase/dehydratase domain-containing protein n=1 Tax=Halioxenophilus aromaticivorans TaxID=1306992 RepID=A0AAV3U9V5_9ALTE
MRKKAVVIGGSGFVGNAIVERLLLSHDVTIIDKTEPYRLSDYVSGLGHVTYVKTDLLADDISIPEGDVYLAHGSGETNVRREWLQIARNVLTTARLVPCLKGRRVILISSVETYGNTCGELTENSLSALPISDELMLSWADSAVQYAKEKIPEWQCQAVCEGFVKSIANDRWVYAVSKKVQELVLTSQLEEQGITILRLANVIGAGQVRVVSKFVHAARYNLPLHVKDETYRSFITIDYVARAATTALEPGVYNVSGKQISLVKLAEQIKACVSSSSTIILEPASGQDSSGLINGRKISQYVPFDQPWLQTLEAQVRLLLDSQLPVFHPPIEVVIPPKPENMQRLTGQFQRALYTGILKSGGPYTTELESRLAELLELPASQRVIATKSGTAALHLCYQAIEPKQRFTPPIAVLPSFTFAATAESLRQRGYRLIFVDVNPDTWTMAVDELEQALRNNDVSVVVSVDALGNPVDYKRIKEVCQRYDVPHIADSAAAFGASYDFSPVGSQASYHAFSLSFAKTVSAGGNGGFAVIPKDVDLSLGNNLLRSQTMTEINAAVTLDQLDHLDVLFERRRVIAEIYQKSASRWGVQWQRSVPNSQNAFVHWVCLIENEVKANRNQIGIDLKRLGVCTKPYYAPALHRTHLAETMQLALPVTDKLVSQCLALPMSSEMTVEDAYRVTMAVDQVMYNS